MRGRKMDLILTEDDATLDELVVAPRRADVIDTMLLEATAEPETESIISV